MTAYSCTDCRDTGWRSYGPDEQGRTSSGPCHCLVQLTRLGILGDRFAKARFGNIEADVAAAGRIPDKTLLIARDRMATDPTGCYFLSGDYGAWKTYLAAAQWNVLYDIELETGAASRPAFFTDVRLYRSLRNAELGEPAAITPDDISTGRISHLVIDDLGKKGVSTFVKTAYFDLIDAIHKRGGAVGLTITSNAVIKMLANDYDMGMIRRIRELCGDELVIRQSPKADR